MKKRILCLLLAVMMLVGMCAVLGSCGGDGGDGDCGHLADPDKFNNGKGVCKECGTKIKHDHEDEDKNGKCDFCTRKMDDKEEEIIQYPWLDEDPIELLVMMSHADNGQQNPSGCERYLAGETKDEDSVDKLVEKRNDNAEELVNVHPTYKYYPKNQDDYDWSRINSIMSSTIKSGKTEGIPDIFVNFTYDLIACSLKGCFENLKNTSIMTNGATEDGNYFEFIDEDYNEEEDNRGYMLDYMNSTTLSQEKTYILASDYFIDLIRSFYIVPVNIALLESVGMEVTGDLNNDDKFTIDDFYIEVMDEKKWTYSKLAEYSEAIHEETGTVAGDDLGDVLGFAIGKGGVATSGIIYSTDIHVIDKVYDDDKGDYEYDYPTTCDTLFDIYDSVYELVNKPGVLVVTADTEGAEVGGDKGKPWLAVRTKFCNNQILFGDVILIGALEFPEYQDLLNNGSGFGVVPVPNYHEFQEGERYVTCIHNTARPGAITYKTKNYTVCTAYLNYLSTHSSDVLETYYNINLQYQFTMGDEGTTRMLQYIRLNVRSAFDKLVEDAVGLYGGPAAYSVTWGYPMTVNNYQFVEMRKFYTGNLGDKNKIIDTLYAEFPKLP